MEIQVTRLREILGILKPAVPRKTALDVLKNVLVKEGQVVATDLDSMVILAVPEADESFLLPYSDVLKMLQYVPGHEYLTLHAKRGKLTLTWSDGEATYPTSNVGDFPDIPDFEAKVQADIDGDTFIAALTSALPYVATDSSRPVLNGVTVLLGEPIEVNAGDGFRMAHIVLPLLFPGEHIIILPPDAVRTLVHVMDKTPRPPPQGDALVPLMLAKRQIGVALDEKSGLKIVFGPTASVIVKLVEGNPPAWLKLIPKDKPVLEAQLFARELETAARRVSSVAHQNNGIVRLQFIDGSATVSAKADGQEVSAKISVLDLQGAPNRFALNIDYLTEYLRNKDSIVSLSWTGGMSPIVLHHSKSPKVLIMPMTAEWGDELPVSQAEPEAAPEAAPEATTSKPQKQRGKKKSK